MTTHPSIPNKLDNLTRIGILVRGLRQPADDRLTNSLARLAPKSRECMRGEYSRVSCS